VGAFTVDELELELGLDDCVAVVVRGSLPVLVDTVELSVAATWSVVAAWASPTVTPAVAKAAAPTTPTVTCRTLRRSARPELLGLPWVMRNSHLSISMRRNLTPFTIKY